MTIILENGEILSYATKQKNNLLMLSIVQQNQWLNIYFFMAGPSLRSSS